MRLVYAVVLITVVVVCIIYSQNTTTEYFDEDTMQSSNTKRQPDSRTFIDLLNADDCKARFPPTFKECNKLYPITQKQCNEALFPINSPTILSPTGSGNRQPYKIPPIIGTWDYNSIIGQPANTWQQMQALCNVKGMKLCNNADLCIDGQPLPNLNKFEGDNWIATGDTTDSWLTYNSAGNRTCKTHVQVAGAPPAWSTSNGPDGWTRAAKCCY